MESCEGCGEELPIQFRTSHPNSPYCPVCLEKRRKQSKLEPHGREQAEYVQRRPTSIQEWNTSVREQLIDYMKKHNLLTIAAYRDAKQRRNEAREFARKHNLKSWNEVWNFLCTSARTAP
jgi:hypothetical protein